MSIEEFECTSEYRRYKREQKIELIKDILCTAAISCLLSTSLIIAIIINL